MPASAPKTLVVCPVACVCLMRGLAVPRQNRWRKTSSAVERLWASAAVCRSLLWLSGQCRNSNAKKVGQLLEPRFRWVLWRHLRPPGWPKIKLRAAADCGGAYTFATSTELQTLAVHCGVARSATESCALAITPQPGILPHVVLTASEKASEALVRITEGLVQQRHGLSSLLDGPPTSSDPSFSHEQRAFLQTQHAYKAYAYDIKEEDDKVIVPDDKEKKFMWKLPVVCYQ